MSEKSPFIVLLQLFVILHHRVNQRQRDKAATLNLESFFISEVTRLGFRGKNMDAIRAYFRAGKGELNIDFSPSDDEMQAMVFTAYELLCNAIGPVATDELFGDAIKNVEKTAAGIAYSPKNFF